MTKSIEEIRKIIDELDDKIIDALAGRQKIVGEILAGKLQGAKEIRDPQREQELMDDVRKKAAAAGMDPYFMEQLFREIIHHSVRYQTQALVDHQNNRTDENTIRVAYQGTDGAFSHQAAMRHFEQRYQNVECIGYTRFDQAAAAVEEEDVDVAILPVENTTAGSINDTYDLLAEKDLYIIGEEILHINHCLMAPEVVSIENIRRILSHPQAIAQCSNFLAGLRCHVESYFDTAMAAHKVQTDGDLSQAAIGSSLAAEIYNLKILKSDLANQEKNYTRFVVVNQDPVACDPQLNCKTSLVFATPDQKGALLNCLNVIGEHGINMTKLESRPRIGHPWQSLFYLDIEGNKQEMRVADAIEKLKRKAQYVKDLGSYPVKEGKW